MANASRCPAAILEAIPWYPDGLSSEECGAVEAHAADCRACRAELAFLRGEEEAGIELPDGDRIYANVIARIGAQTARNPIGRLRRRAAKQMSVAAGLLTALVSGMLTTGAIWVVRVTPTYETSAVEVALPEGAGPQIDVVFRSEATVEEVGTALRTSEATIVSGPTPRGVYRLRIAPSGNLARALEQLRGGGRGVAIFAEPVGSQEADSRVGRRAVSRRRTKIGRARRPTRESADAQ